MKDIHIETGHGSVQTMHYLLNSRYSWKNLAQDLEEFTKKCETCARASNRKRQKHHWVSRTMKANEKWQVDLIGPLEQTQQGNRYIFNIVDCFTKFTFAIPLKNKGAKEIVFQLNKILKENQIRPKVIQSDNECEF